MTPNLELLASVLRVRNLKIKFFDKYVYITLPLYLYLQNVLVNHGVWAATWPVTVWTVESAIRRLGNVNVPLVMLVLSAKTVSTNCFDWIYWSAYFDHRPNMSLLDDGTKSTKKPIFFWSLSVTFISTIFQLVLHRGTVVNVESVATVAKETVIQSVEAVSAIQVMLEETAKKVNILSLVCQSHIIMYFCRLIIKTYQTCNMEIMLETCALYQSFDQEPGLTDIIHRQPLNNNTFF